MREPLHEVPDGSAREDVDQVLDAQLTEAREAPLIALCARRRWLRLAHSEHFMAKTLQQRRDERAIRHAARCRRLESESRRRDLRVADVHRHAAQRMRFEAGATQVAVGDALRHPTEQVHSLAREGSLHAFQHPRIVAVHAEGQVVRSLQRLAPLGPVSRLHMQSEPAEHGVYVCHVREILGK